MTKTVGLWIDLQKAVIVSATERSVEVESRHSDIDNCRWQLDVWEVPAAIRLRMSNDHMERFYKDVSDRVLDARFILIFGPGEAKREIIRRIGSDNFTGAIVGVESAGSMTDFQIVMKCQNQFQFFPALDTDLALSDRTTTNGSLVMKA